MKRKKLIDEIIDFYIEYGIIKNTEIEDVRQEMKEHLKHCDFLESLINTIIVKTRHRKNIDTEKIKKLLLELEKIRLELEYDR